MARITVLVPTPLFQTVASPAEVSRARQQMLSDADAEAIKRLGTASSAVINPQGESSL